MPGPPTPCFWCSVWRWLDSVSDGHVVLFTQRITEAFKAPVNLEFCVLGVCRMFEGSKPNMEVSVVASSESPSGEEVLLWSM